MGSFLLDISTFVCSWVVGSFLWDISTVVFLGSGFTLVACLLGATCLYMLPHVVFGDVSLFFHSVGHGQRANMYPNRTRRRGAVDVSYQQGYRCQGQYRSVLDISEPTEISKLTRGLEPLSLCAGNFVAGLLHAALRRELQHQQCELSWSILACIRIHVLFARTIRRYISRIVHGS